MIAQGQTGSGEPFKVVSLTSSEHVAHQHPEPWGLGTLLPGCRLEQAPEAGSLDRGGRQAGAHS